MQGSSQQPSLKDPFEHGLSMFQAAREVTAFSAHSVSLFQTVFLRHNFGERRFSLLKCTFTSAPLFVLAALGGQFIARTSSPLLHEFLAIFVMVSAIALRLSHQMDAQTHRRQVLDLQDAQILAEERERLLRGENPTQRIAFLRAAAPVSSVQRVPAADAAPLTVTDLLTTPPPEPPTERLPRDPHADMGDAARRANVGGRPRKPSSIS